jgi:hypothetical protein
MLASLAWRVKNKGSRPLLVFQIKSTESLVCGFPADFNAAAVIHRPSATDLIEVDPEAKKSALGALRGHEMRNLNVHSFESLLDKFFP